MNDPATKVTRTPPGSSPDGVGGTGSATGFAGMPVSEADDLRRHLKQGPPKRGMWFTLPSDVVRGIERRFLIIELNTDKEDHANRLAGQGLNLQGAITQQSIAAIGAIGDTFKPTYDQVREWREAIGPIGRKLVETGFHRVNTPENKVTESFLDSAQPWSG